MTILPLIQEKAQIPTTRRVMTHGNIAEAGRGLFASMGRVDQIYTTELGKKGWIMALPFTPDSADASILLLWSVFGQVVSEIAKGMGVVTNLTDLSNTAWALEMIPGAPGPGPAAPAWSQMPFNIGGGTGIVSVINSGVLFFAALLLSWTTVFGIVNTANDGEALGKKWSTLMTPLRTLTAASMLIPTSTGFSAIQIFVLIVAILSCGLASYGWKKYTGTAMAQELGNIYQSAITRDGGTKDLVIDLYRMGMCVKGYNEALAQVSPSYTPAMQIVMAADMTGYQITQDRMSITMGLNTYDANQKNTTGNICGKVTVNGEMNAPLQITGSAVLKPTLTGIMNPVADVATKQGNSAALTRFSIMSGFLCGAAGNTVCSAPSSTFVVGEFAKGKLIGDSLKQLVDDSKNAIQNPAGAVNSADFRKIVDDLNELLRTELEKVVTAMATQNYQYTDANGAVTTVQSSQINNLTRGGWIFAGSYHNQVSTVKNILRAKTKITGTYQATAPTWDMGAVLTDKDLLSAATGVMTEYHSMADTVSAKAYSDATGIANVKDTLSDSKGKGFQAQGAEYSVSCGFGGFKTEYSPAEIEAATDIKGDFLKITEGWGKKTVAMFTSQIGKSGIDPIMQIKHAGDCMVIAGEFIIVGGNTLDGFLRWLTETIKAAGDATNSSVLGKFGAGFVSAAVYSAAFAASSTVHQMVEMLTPGAHGLLYLGYFMGYWIPLIPFVVFTLGVIGWLAGVLEAVLAAPLWAAMHMTPGGDSFIGSQDKGYLLILGVFFRPILMVIGLIASLTMLYPAMWLVNKSYALVMAGLQDSAGDVTGVFSIVVFVLIYCIIIFQVIMFCFTLPQKVPGQILSWIGSGISDFGEAGAAERVGGVAHGAGGAVKGAVRESQLKQQKRLEDKFRRDEQGRERSQSQEMLSTMRGGRTYGASNSNSPVGLANVQSRGASDSSPRMEALERVGSGSTPSLATIAKEGLRAGSPTGYAIGATAVRGVRLAGATATYYGKGAINKMAGAFSAMTGSANRTGRIS